MFTTMYEKIRSSTLEEIKQDYEEELQEIAGSFTDADSWFVYTGIAIGFVSLYIAPHNAKGPVPPSSLVELLALFGVVFGGFIVLGFLAALAHAFYLSVQLNIIDDVLKDRAYKEVQDE